MDREEARFILRSFRPDGADAADSDFAEALQAAAGDRELADWLARERAMDSAIAAAMAATPVPATLRDDILGSLTANRGDLPQAEDELDAAVIGALATIRPPDSLRAQAIAAMERSALAARPALWKRVGVPLAAAAGVALAFALVRQEPTAAPATTASRPAPIPVDLIEAGFVRTFTTPFFSVDPARAEGMPVEHLEERKLPCPKLLPPGLQNLEAVGCRELVIDGKRGSLVCFDQREGGTLHLVIFKRQDVSGDLPCHKAPQFGEHGCFSVARWCDGRHVFMLLGTTEISRLERCFVDSP